MKDKMLGIITTILLLVGCDSSDSGGLSFDVTGHWQLLADVDEEAGLDPVINLVIDSEGRFIGTDGIDTMVGRETDSFKLAGVGVGGTGLTCFSEGGISDVDCVDLSFSLAIKDDNTLAGTLSIEEDSEEFIIDVTLKRLTALNKVVGLAGLAGSWVSIETGTALQINPDGSFVSSNPNGDTSEGFASEAANNMFSIDGEVTIDDNPIAIIGLGFIDQDDLLNVGVSGIALGSVITIGDLYERVE